MIESLYAIVTRRIRDAGTIFGDRVKLVLRQSDAAHWSKLAKPYLLVVPTQTRSPLHLEVDYMNFVNARVMTLVGQFDGQGSEADYKAAGDIELAEKQLMFTLANWSPPRNCSFTWYRPTLYAGMRFQDARVPDVKVHFYFTFEEQVALVEKPEFDEDDVALALDAINVRVRDPCCTTPRDERPCWPPMPRIQVTGGGCPQKPQPDLCVEECEQDECAPEGAK